MPKSIRKPLKRQTKKYFCYCLEMDSQTVAVLRKHLEDFLGMEYAYDGAFFYELSPTALSRLNPDIRPLVTIACELKKLPQPLPQVRMPHARRTHRSTRSIRYSHTRL